MSSIKEDSKVTPWVSRTSCRNSLTIVIVSSNNDIIENISEALIDVHAIGDFRWKLEVLRSFHLEDITRQSISIGKKSIDFLIIAIDTCRIYCLEWARIALEQVHPDLRIRRVILVNASGLPVNALGIKSSEILTFCSENRLEMLSADVSKLKDAQYLAQRLLKYIEVSLGLESGIPNLNI